MRNATLIPFMSQWRTVATIAPGRVTLAWGAKRMFEPTFTPTTTDRHVAAVGGSDRQRLLRPTCIRSLCGRFLREAASQQTALLKRRGPLMAANRPPIYCHKAAGRDFGEFCRLRLPECKICWADGHNHYENKSCGSSHSPFSGDHCNCDSVRVGCRLDGGVPAAQNSARLKH
jgi:hypothetical protein